MKYWRTRAAEPATTGVAMEVPCRQEWWFGMPAQQHARCWACEAAQEGSGVRHRCIAEWQPAGLQAAACTWRTNGCRCCRQQTMQHICILIAVNPHRHGGQAAVLGAAQSHGCRGDGAWCQDVGLHPLVGGGACRASGQAEVSMLRRCRFRRQRNQAARQAGMSAFCRPTCTDQTPPHPGWSRRPGSQSCSRGRARWQTTASPPCPRLL